MPQTSCEEIRIWIQKSTKLFIKKLSRNDCGWADGQEYGHQNGVYIPQEIQKSDFFPVLRNINPLKPHIYESVLPTFWPATGEIRSSRLKHYSNKGPEMHFTRVPKDAFAELTPASLLIGGVLKEAIGEAHHWFMVVDSATEDAEVIETIFDLKTDFHYEVFEPRISEITSLDETESLIEELTFALNSETLENFISTVTKLPAPEVLASQAQTAYLRQNGLTSLDPFSIPNPGDAIMNISRDIEYKLYKKAELRHRAAEVIRILYSGKGDLVSSVVRGFPKLDATFLSASQHRKSRAGRSFEQHIARLLDDGDIKYTEQAVTGGRRPDFVLPDLASLSNLEREIDEVLVLSAKTTLRERWKQITMERFNCGLFLATVDDRISSDAIEDMNRHGIFLVVPESLKKSKETCYNAKGNVITFRDFFDEEISKKRPNLKRNQ